MDSIRMVVYVCVTNIKKAWRLPKTYIAILWVAFLFTTFTQLLKQFCITVNINSSPWIFPFLTNDFGNQMFIILGALLLFCDAPFLNQNSMWQILRAGRIRWFSGNLLYIWIMSLIYTLILGILPILLTLPYIEWTAGWGKVLGSLAQTNAASQIGINTLDYSIMVHFTPAQAMVLTLLAVWLNVVLIGMLNYTFNLIVKNGIGAVASVILGLTPLLITRLVRFAVGYYLAPPLWMDLSNYRWKSYGYGPSFTYVYSVLLGAITVCMFLSYLSVKKRDLNFAEEL